MSNIKIAMATPRPLSYQIDVSLFNKFSFSSSPTEREYVLLASPSGRDLLAQNLVQNEDSSIIKSKQNMGSTSTKSPKLSIYGRHFSIFCILVCRLDRP